MSDLPVSDSVEELPLGWCWRDSGPDALQFVETPNRKAFLHCGDLQGPQTEGDLFARVRALSARGVLVKGCSVELARKIRDAGGQMLILSHAARLELATYKAPSKVRNMEKKGAKAVEVREVPCDAAHEALAAAFFATVRPPGAPKIELAYRTSLLTSARAWFAYTREGGKLVGLMSVTRYGPGKWHGELLARHPEAPGGTMETLVLEIAAKLKSEGATVFNLGDVPLVMVRGDDGVIVGWQHFSLLNKLLAWLSPFFARLVKSNYDVQGLYQFKKKFEPVWEPRALCGFPSLGVLDIMGMARVTGISQLFAKPPRS